MNTNNVCCQMILNGSSCIPAILLHVQRCTWWEGKHSCSCDYTHPNIICANEFNEDLNSVPMNSTDNSFRNFHEITIYLTISFTPFFRHKFKNDLFNEKGLESMISGMNSWKPMNSGVPRSVWAKILYQSSCMNSWKIMSF